MANEWFWKGEDDTVQPLTPEAMRKLAATGVLTPTSLVRKGDGDWIEARKIKGLVFPSSSPATAEQRSSKPAPASADVYGLAFVEETNSSAAPAPEDPPPKRIPPKRQHAKIKAVKSATASLLFRSFKGIAFCRDSRHLVICGASKPKGHGVIVWNIEASSERPLDAPVNYSAVAVSPDGHLVAANSFWGDWNEVLLLDLNTGQKVGRLSTSGNVSKGTNSRLPLSSSIGFSEDGTRLLAGSTNGTVVQWKIERGNDGKDAQQTHIRLPGSSLDVIGLAVATESNRFVCATETSTVFLCKPKPVALNLACGGVPGRINPVAISPRGDLLASQPEPGKVVITNLDSQSPQQTLHIFPGPTPGLPDLWALSIAFSPNGSRVAVACSDGTVRVCDVATGVERLNLGVGLDAQCVAFSPDGHLLAAASLSAVKIWNASTGSVLTTLNAAMCFIATAAAGSPDGTSRAREVELLRRFRDTKMMGQKLGQRLIALYERVSPPIAEWLMRQPLARTIVLHVVVWPAALLARIAFAWDAGKISSANALRPNRSATPFSPSTADYVSK